MQIVYIHVRYTPTQSLFTKGFCRNYLKCMIALPLVLKWLLCAQKKIVKQFIKANTGQVNVGFSIPQHAI